MSSELCIRPAIEADLAAVQALLVATWHDTYDQLIGRDEVTDITSRWHAIDVLRCNLRDARSIFLVAELDNTLAGHAFADVSSAGEGVLKRLYVSPNCQRRGIGSALLEEVMRRIGRDIAIVLEVEQQNAKAIAFYAGNGFVETGRTDHCGDDSDIPAIKMRRVPAVR